MALIQSVGQASCLLAAIVYILANADPKQSTATAAYIQVVRLGGAETATTIMATFLRHREQLHSYLLGLHVQAGGAHTEGALGLLSHAFSGDGSSPQTLAGRSMASLSSLVSQQANVLAYMDGFQVTFWVALIGLAAPGTAGPGASRHTGAEATPLAVPAPTPAANAGLEAIGSRRPSGRYERRIKSTAPHRHRAMRAPG